MNKMIENKGLSQEKETKILNILEKNDFSRKVCRVYEKLVKNKEKIEKSKKSTCDEVKEKMDSLIIINQMDYYNK